MSTSESRRGPQARTLRIAGVVVVAVIVVVVAGVLLPLIATSTPEFFSRYHLLERRYVNLEDSAHEGIGCRACHETRALENGIELVVDYYVSLVQSDPLPRYFAFEPPSRDACLQCHVDDWSSEARWTERIPHPAHQRVASEERDCVGCHKWTAHLETYMEKHKEMPFSGVCVAYGCHVGTKSAEECFDCHHVLHEEGEEWLTSHPRVIKATGQSACTESCHDVAQCQMCHTTGERPEFTGLPIEVGMKSIEELHVKPEWTARYHGEEAVKDPSRCTLCHQSEGECDECHLERPAFHGSTETWVGRHSKRSDGVDDPRCLVACHEKPWCEDCHQQFKEME